MSMNTIWKYAIPIDDDVKIDMPKSADVLCVQIQKGMPTLWAIVDSESPKVQRHFKWFGTGHPLLDGAMKYCGTVQMVAGHLVFHLFEVMP